MIMVLLSELWMEEQKEEWNSATEIDGTRQLEMNVSNDLTRTVIGIDLVMWRREGNQRNVVDRCGGQVVCSTALKYR